MLSKQTMIGIAMGVLGSSIFYLTKDKLSARITSEKNNRYIDLEDVYLSEDNDTGRRAQREDGNDKTLENVNHLKSDLDGMEKIINNLK